MKTVVAVMSSILLFVVSGFAVAAESTPNTIDGTVKVSAEKVIDLVESMDNLLVIDARKVSDYQKGHIPDSLNLPNTETNPLSLAQHIKSKESPVLFYCNGVNCGRSVEACKIAVKAGYTNVYWFRGGIKEWEDKGFPVEK